MRKRKRFWVSHSTDVDKVKKLILKLNFDSHKSEAMSFYPPPFNPNGRNSQLTQDDFIQCIRYLLFALQSGVVAPDFSSWQSSIGGTLQRVDDILRRLQWTPSAPPPSVNTTLSPTPVIVPPPKIKKELFTLDE